MSSLRAAAKATAPDGRRWEIYAYRGRTAPASGRFLRIRRLFARRAREWTVEAVSWAPYPLRYRWTTPSETKGQVLAGIEGQLVRGERPMPRNAKQML
jgi:hypothetical protein